MTPISPKTLRYNEGKCARCPKDGIGYNADGKLLCEDCIVEEMLPSEVAVRRERSEWPDRQT